MIQTTIPEYTEHSVDYCSFSQNITLLTLPYAIRIKDHWLLLLINITPLPHYFAVVNAAGKASATLASLNGMEYFSSPLRNSNHQPCNQPWWKSHIKLMLLWYPLRLNLVILIHSGLDRHNDLAGHKFGI